jgi:hypothetical protein
MDRAMTTQAINATVGVIALLILIAGIGVAIRAHDRRRKREDEAFGLQAMMSDALMVDPRLAGLVLTPTVRPSYRSRAPMTVALSGTVPRPELREVALEVARRAVGQRGGDVLIEDHIAIDPLMSRHAA